MVMVFTTYLFLFLGIVTYTHGCGFPNNQCINGTCHIDNAKPTCTYGCNDAYAGTFCQETCRYPCLACERGNLYQCTLCPQGKYGGRCENECLNCLNHKCTINGTCTEGCKPFWWGKSCDEPCSPNCEDGCDVFTGNCNDGNEDNSNHTCSINCKLCNETDCQTCNVTSGECLQGCKEGFTGFECENISCTIGLSSSNCEDFPLSTAENEVSTTETSQQPLELQNHELTMSLAISLPVVVVVVVTITVIIYFRRKPHQKERVDSLIMDTQTDTYLNATFDEVEDTVQNEDRQQRFTEGGEGHYACLGQETRSNNGVNNYEEYPRDQLDKRDSINEDGYECPRPEWEKICNQENEINEYEVMTGKGLPRGNVDSNDENSGEGEQISTNPNGKLVDNCSGQLREERQQRYLENKGDNLDQNSLSKKQTETKSGGGQTSTQHSEYKREKRQQKPLEDKDSIDKNSADKGQMPSQQSGDRNEKAAVEGQQRPLEDKADNSDNDSVEGRQMSTQASEVRSRQLEEDGQHGPPEVKDNHNKKSGGQTSTLQSEDRSEQLRMEGQPSTSTDSQCGEYLEMKTCIASRN